MLLLEDLDGSAVLRAVAAGLGVAAVVLCAWIGLVSREELRSTRLVRFFHITLPAVSHYKLIGLFGMFLLPLGTVGLSTFELFEGNKEADACVRCHVMRPMANDMTDAQSESLAARHYRNRWIAEQQCYQCHTDYGFSGTIEAKLTGLRHLLRYTTATYEEPIRLPGAFHSRNCMHCHGGTPKYAAAEMHEIMADTIASDETSCTSCHGDAHPSPDRRSPGHADYPGLMRNPGVLR